MKESSWFHTSLILNEDEGLSLVQMTQMSIGNLLYRASLHGFTADAFHEKCNGLPNTITIIKNNFDYVFGGFTTASWTSDDTYARDKNAFIFSVRRNGTTKSRKFFGHSYTPSEDIRSTDYQYFLAHNYNKWLATEIEVYQLIK